MDLLSRNKGTFDRRQFLKAGAALGTGLLASGAVGCALNAESAGAPIIDDPIGDPPQWPPREVGPTLSGDRPNILLIYNDQHRADALGCMGNSVIQTPNLDFIASQGVTFGRCFTNAPICRPARTSMMSGLYPHQHGVGCNTQIPDPQMQSHVRQMRDDAGYCTSIIGKTHLHKETEHLSLGMPALQEWGFEHIHEVHGTGQFIMDIDSAFTDWLASRFDGKTSKLTQFRSYMASYRDGLWRHPWDLPAFDDLPFNLEVTDHLDWYTAVKAADWLASYDDARPFYLQLNMHGPHDPFDATSLFRDLYSVDDPDLPQGILDPPATPVPGLIQDLMTQYDTQEITVARLRMLQVQYYAKITQLDAALGQVIDVMGDRGMLDNTWIIYSSDHGELLGDHQLMGKGAFYESALRVPLIIRPPGGLVQPIRSDAMTQTVDIPATVLDIGDQEQSPGRGRSLVSTARPGFGDPDSSGDVQAVISENLGHAMIRTSRYKLVIDVEAAVTEELYDLYQDQNELNNLVGNPDYIDRQHLLEEQYQQFVDSSRA